MGRFPSVWRHISVVLYQIMEKSGLEISGNVRFKIKYLGLFNTDCIDGVVLKCSIFIANALEILWSLTIPSICDLEENFRRKSTCSAWPFGNGISRGQELFIIVYQFVRTDNNNKHRNSVVLALFFLEDGSGIYRWSLESLWVDFRQSQWCGNRLQITNLSCGWIGSIVHDDVIKWKDFRVTGHLCRKFTGHQWLPHTKASDAELWCFLWSAPE